ncbi:hypothetical protein ES703_65879 [subsurface metagenome]
MITKLVPGPIGHILTSAGPGHIPVWAPPVGSFERWLVATIDLTKDVQKLSPVKSYARNAPLATEHKQAYGDAPADLIKRLTPAIALVDAESIVTPDRTHNKNAPLASEIGLKKVVDGAVADDGGVQTDETVAAQNPTINDMTLLPAAPAVDDAYYLGFDYLWDLAWVNVSQAGVGNWGLAHEYWNGAAWAALSDVIDETSEWTVAGTNKISFTRPGDWARTTIQGHNLYWIRARMVSFVNITTQPLGAQAWCEILI